MNIEKRERQAGARFGWDFGSILALGISFGFIVGLLLENTGVGLSLGLGVAVFLNALREKRQQEKGSTIALVIATAALIAVAGLWFWPG